jgi:hypothetical protein
MRSASPVGLTGGPGDDPRIVLDRLLYRLDA